MKAPELICIFGRNTVCRQLIAALCLVALLFCSSRTFASKIGRLPLDNLPEQSDLIVLAEVAKVEQVALDERRPIPYDEVTIKVSTVLKGQTGENQLSVVLQPRGVKDFDPELAVGDMGVFFLKDVAGGKAKLAYHGSVTAFQKRNFVMQAGPATPLDEKPEVNPDPIEQLVSRLSATHGLWVNGMSPVIDLPSTASVEEVLVKVFELTGFDEGYVQKHRVIAVRKVAIPNPPPPVYTAVLTETDLGKKIVLLKYEGKILGWWSRVYDVK